VWFANPYPLFKGAMAEHSLIAQVRLGLGLGLGLRLGLGLGLRLGLGLGLGLGLRLSVADGVRAVGLASEHECGAVSQRVGVHPRLRRVEVESHQDGSRRACRLRRMLRAKVEAGGSG